MSPRDRCCPSPLPSTAYAGASSTGVGRDAPFRIPEALWTVALAAARAHGVYRTARTLRLNYTDLKRRLAGRTAHPPSQPSSSSSPRRAWGVRPAPSSWKRAGHEAPDPAPGDRPARPHGAQPDALADRAMIQVTPQLRILVAVDRRLPEGDRRPGRVCKDASGAIPSPAPCSSSAIAAGPPESV